MEVMGVYCGNIIHMRWMSPRAIPALTTCSRSIDSDQDADGYQDLIAAAGGYVKTLPAGPKDLKRIRRASTQKRTKDPAEFPLQFFIGPSLAGCPSFSHIYQCMGYNDSGNHHNRKFIYPGSNLQRFENIEKSAGQLLVDHFEEHGFFGINTSDMGLNYTILTSVECQFAIDAYAHIFGANGDSVRYMEILQHPWKGLPENKSGT